MTYVECGLFDIPHSGLYGGMSGDCRTCGNPKLGYNSGYEIMTEHVRGEVNAIGFSPLIDHSLYSFYR